MTQPTSPAVDNSPTGRRSVAIIGGGFTGAACAVHMARAADTPLAIDIIEPRPTVGGGVAYGSAAPEHRINVPSDRMTVFAEQPKDFSEWLDRGGRRNADPAGWTPEGHFYAKRLVFGEYMAELVREAAGGNSSGSTIRHVEGKVSGVTRSADGFEATVASTGEARRYSAVVVAATHAAPSFKWPLLDGASALPHLYLDPWRSAEMATIGRDARVLILGTGLTMADVVTTLREAGHKGRILAVSRHGLLPHGHAEFDSEFACLEGDDLPPTALALLRLTRRRVAEAESRGLSWRAALDALRRTLPAIWPQLPPPERRKALRFLRSFWDVHRFRMSPQVAGILAQGAAAGWLEVSAGKVIAIGREGNRFGVVWTPRGSSERADPFDAVVNCTGPEADLARSGNPLFQSLIEAGLARPDPFRLGLEVDAEARALSSEGVPNPRLRVAGPLARGYFGELMGLPEVSAHARFVAEAMAAELARGEP